MVRINTYYSAIGKKFDPNALRIFWSTDSHVLASVDRNPSAEGAILGTRYFYTGATKIGLFRNAVNSNQPHLAVFTGDALEQYNEETMNLFLNSWNAITVRKEALAGNHDLYPDQTILNTTLADKYGYGSKSITAGSKFNQSFGISNANYSARVIMAETNLDSAGNPFRSAIGSIHSSVISYIETELLNCTESTALIFSHHGMQDNSSHFDPVSGQAFKTMIDNVKVQKPNLKIFNFFGHNHRDTLKTWTEFGNNITGYSIPPVVDYAVGYYAVMYVTNGKVEFEIKTLPYV
jgi:hypothetical protein